MASELERPIPETFCIQAPKAWELYAYGVVRTLVNVLNRTAWRVTVIGAEKLPAGPFILAPVHRSNLDTLFVASLTKRRLRFMGKDGVWKYRMSGAIFSALGGFPVHRGIADREAIRRCNLVLAGGEPLVLFPEGTRKSGPIVEGLFEGAAYIAIKGKVPIVPVGIGGSERAWAKNRKMPRFTKVVLVVGDPIYPDVDGNGGRVSRSSLKAFSERLSYSLQALFDKAQAILDLD
ncbi:MAG: lysophospholipid acyltransferase family protein [Actinomycetota bacterium]|jgi:1-acyl-sn-glycerol-3-phosphate acyltransferase|nr:lysophospholipid acyltransferase family protein [Actinomycetota bacterium]